MAKEHRVVAIDELPRTTVECNDCLEASRRLSTIVASFNIIQLFRTKVKANRRTLAFRDDTALATGGDVFARRRDTPSCYLFEIVR